MTDTPDQEIVAQSMATEVPASNQQVIDFLRANPDFFMQHSDLLPDLNFDELSGGAFAARKIKVLTDRESKLNEQLVNLVCNARANEQLEQRIYEFALRLIELAKSGDDCDWVAAVKDVFSIKYGSLLTSEVAASAYDICLAKVDGANSYLDNNFATEVLDTVFGDDHHIGSVALIAVPAGSSTAASGAGPSAILILGANDPERFSPQKGTLYTDRVGAMLGAVLSE